MTDGLNQRQQAYVLSIWSGLPQTEAYLDAYRNGQRPAVDSNPYMNAATAASRLSKNVKVAAALDHLREESKSDAIADHQERLVELTKIIRGEREGDLIRAVHEANKMDGGHSARQSEVHVEGGISLMSMILDAQTHDLRS